MSCGLGAVILVLMLVRQDPRNVTLEADRLAADLVRLERVERELGDRLAEIRQAADDAGDEAAAQGEALGRARGELARRRAEIAGHAAALRDLERAVGTAKAPEPRDPGQVRRKGGENHIMGLRVEGERIAILVDASASMTDEKLIDVIRRKNMSGDAQRKGPKWQRTRRVVAWLLERLPDGARTVVVAFNSKATRLGAKTAIEGWDEAGVRRVLADLEGFVPTGPTNLASGLAAVAAHRPTDLYLVTDGLPTAGTSGYRSLNPFAGCSSLWGASRTISGACRAALARHTIAGAGLDGARVNVVLLPIEGDPAAAHEYWRWTASPGGILISPASSWP